MTETPENIKLLNEKLGITDKENLFNSEGVKSIQEMLESSKRDFELLCDNIASKKEELEKAEKDARESFDDLARSTKENEIQKLEVAAVANGTFAESLSSMLEIIYKGNTIISGLYDAMVSTNIIDPDLVNAVATFIHSIRETNDNLIQLQMQKYTLEHQFRTTIETEKLKQRNRLELEYFKWQLRQKEIERKAELKAKENEASNVAPNITDSGDSKMWSQAEMAEILRRGSIHD